MTAATRRTFLNRSIAVGACLGGSLFAKEAKAKDEREAAKDDISIAQWALVREIREGVWKTLDFPRIAREDFGINGIDVAYEEEPLEFNGGILNVVPPPKDYSWELNGQLLIKYEEYGFFGCGSYAQPDPSQGNDWPSFFLFVMVDAPIGGPPYLYVSGLAGGFGFNRGLKIPEAGQLLSFPLVQGALGEGDLQAGMSADQALEKMSDWVYPETGAFWIAAGVAVGSCQLLNAFVMVAGVFGTTFEIAVIGVGTCDVPPDSPDLIANLELGLVGVFAPLQGKIELTAAITSTSYLFVPQCKLTGGYAYSIWFAGQHMGNFLISLGGRIPS